MEAIPYGKQTITDEDIASVTEALKSDFLTQGPRVAAFEKEFADYIGCKYAVAVSNGTAGLHLATLALGVQNGDNVITTPITFAASANCVRYCGGNIYFADIDPVTYLIDIQKVEALIKSKPSGFFKGIIPVDFAGYPVNLAELRKLADNYGLWIIEDACHAPGAEFNSAGKKFRSGDGNFADAAVFSFHPVKHIATGEGGIVSTNDEQVYRKLLLYRTHGITKEPDQLHENHGGWYYEMQDLGYNYRITDFQAALGSSQLKRANQGLKRRQEIADRYNSELKGLPIDLPKVHEGIKHAYHLYVIQTENRKGLYNYLRLSNIFTQVHYIPVHLQPYYKNLGWSKGDLPVAEEYYDRCLSLPMYPGLTDAQQEFVIKTIKEFYG